MGLFEHSVNERSLAVVYVGDNGYVPDVFSLLHKSFEINKKRGNRLHSMADLPLFVQYCCYLLSSSKRAYNLTERAMTKLLKATIYSLLATALFLPQAISAHEVYVLPEKAVERDLALANTNPLHLLYLTEQRERFFFFLLIYLVIIGMFAVVAWHRPLQEKTAPFLNELKNHAGAVIRIFAGLGLVIASLNGALFGPELAVSIIYHSELIRVLEFVIGMMLVLGLLTRVAAVGLVLLFSAAFSFGSGFAFSYLVYLGAVAYGMGGTKFCLDLKLFSPRKNLVCYQDTYAEMFLRVMFGLSLIWSAVYVKILHAPLALDVVETYGLTRYLPFEPLFIVLGAALIELSIGFSFLIGFLVRFNALLLIALTLLSVSFFGEALWPHLILVGAAIAVFMQGYDKYSIFGIFKKDKEPVF
jgi:uncharacterized membrane protein YphA (DoxX/SURF4 family)